jgi:hypothetical protein
MATIIPHLENSAFTCGSATWRERLYTSLRIFVPCIAASLKTLQKSIKKLQAIY